jgi:hypothetical protein
MRCAIFGIVLLSLGAMACSNSSRRQTTTYKTGEKAASGSLVYTVVDTEIMPQLGDDPSSARTPEHRFYLVNLAISNSGNAETPVPGMTLVDDSGQNYSELADGAKVPRWLGMVRKVGAAQTEAGNIVFDAPAKHYRLKLTDDLDEKDIFVDIPLSFVHEQMKNLQTVPNPPQEIPGR